MQSKDGENVTALAPEARLTALALHNATAVFGLESRLRFRFSPALKHLVVRTMTVPR